MKARPNIYESVLVIGGGSPAGGATSGRVGGWLQPNLGLSYLLAARHVLEAGERERRLNEVVLPAAYLQRHAMELALKGVLDAAYSLRRDEDWLERLKTDPKAKPGEAQKVPEKHPLNFLVSKIRDALVAVRHPAMPDEVAAMAERLTEVEGSEPTRTRYLTLRNGEQSFPKAVVLPVGETQDDLEGLFERVFEYQGMEGEPEQWNLVTSLAIEGEAVDQAILQIVPLSELRSGGLPTTTRSLLSCD